MPHLGLVRVFAWAAGGSACVRRRRVPARCFPLLGCVGWFLCSGVPCGRWVSASEGQGLGFGDVLRGVVASRSDALRCRFSRFSVGTSCLRVSGFENRLYFVYRFPRSACFSPPIVAAQPADWQLVSLACSAELARLLLVAVPCLSAVQLVDAGCVALASCWLHSE